MGSVYLGQHRRVLKSDHKKGSERRDERINTWQIHGGHSLRGYLSYSCWDFWLPLVAQTRLTKGM